MTRNKMATLSKNTKLCLVGSVSAGKSTFLNSVFCKKLTQCKIKRTTMVPTRYIESETAIDTEEDIIWAEFLLSRSRIANKS